MGFFRLSNQNLTSIGIREKMEDLGEKMKTHVSKFSQGPGQKLALGKVEESQVFPEVKHSKFQNGFFTMYSLGRDLSETIFSFPIG